MNPSAATCILAWRRIRRFPTSERFMAVSLVFVVIEAHLWRSKLSIGVSNVRSRGILRVVAVCLAHHSIDQYRCPLS